jgi:hypothetical protein
MADVIITDTLGATADFQIRDDSPLAKAKSTQLVSSAPEAYGGDAICLEAIDDADLAGLVEQIAALAKQYTQFDPDTFQDAFQKGNVSMQPNPDQGTISLIIKSFLKPNDTVTLVFNRQQKALQSFNVDSYLNDPSNAVKISAQFAKIPSGPNHVASVLVNGVSKQLTVNIQNSDYQPVS